MNTETPQGIETTGGNRTTHILKLLKNIYGQRQGYWVCNQQLTKGQEYIGPRQSMLDGCTFYPCEVIFIVYVDNGIFASPSNAEIDQAITEIALKFDIEDQRNLNN